MLALATEPLVFFLLYFCALYSFRYLKTGFRADRGGGRLPALIVVTHENRHQRVEVDRQRQTAPV